MKVTIASSALNNGNAVRGVGRYTRDLLAALKKQTDIQVSETVDADTDIIHYPYFDFFFHTLPLRKQKKTIVTIHDAIPLRYPKQYPVGMRGRANLLLQKMALGNVAKIVTVSQTSKRDLVQMVKIAEEKIVVIPPYVSAAFTPVAPAIITAVREAYRLPDKFALYVGDINYNKNIPTLIEGFAKSNAEIALVLAGEAFTGPKIPELQRIQAAIKASGIADKIRCIGFVAEADLPALYAAATCYVQPSLYEGFGLPIVEAMACGTPVICADAASLPEVAGDAALYFDPADAISLADAVSQLLAHPQLQRTLRNKGFVQASHFSEAQFTKAMVAVYQTVASDLPERV